MGFRILVINPGSVSTKIAYFEDERKVWEEKLHHPIEELRKYSKLIEQLPMRKEIIIESMHRHGLREVELSAIAARGGLLKPLMSGVYRVNRRMLDDLSSMKYGAHASNLGAILGVEIGQPYNVPVLSGVNGPSPFNALLTSTTLPSLCTPTEIPPPICATMNAHSS